MARQCRSGTRKAGTCTEACNQNTASPQRGSADPQVAKTENNIEKGSATLSCGCLDQPSASSSDKLSQDGWSSNSIITADEQALFKASGYLLKDKVFSKEEVSSMKAELQRLRPQMVNSCVLQGKENNQLHKLSQKSVFFGGFLTMSLSRMRRSRCLEDQWKSTWIASLLLSQHGQATTLHGTRITPSSR